MNQILEFGSEKSGKAPRSNGGGGGGSSSDKVIKVFAFLLMIIAIALIASGVFSLMKNKKDTETNTNIPESTVKALINAEKDEQSGKVMISISSEIAIDRLIYNWDKGTEKVISGENELTLEQSIDLPAGTHTLTIKVIDMEKHETTESFSFESETGIDTTLPKITLVVTENKKLSITATDDTALAFITYRWNDEEQITVEAEEEGQKEINIELEIPIGKNTIYVVAVDSSETPNTKSAVKTLEGVTKPEISYVLSEDSSLLTLICTHENGIKNIFYTFAGQNYEANFEGDEISTRVEFSQQSVEGYNELNLKVTSVNGIVATFDPYWDYYPNGEPTSENTPDSNNPQQ